MTRDTFKAKGSAAGTDALVAQLDDYLQGCPDPNKVWPKWMVKKSSRLLWACREALLEESTEEGE